VHGQCGGYITRITLAESDPGVEAGSNTSIVALRVVGGDEKEPSTWGYNWVTLFLEDINKGTWPFRLGESRIWDSKIWSWVPRDSNPRMTALARTSNNWKRHTCSSTERAPTSTKPLQFFYFLPRYSTTEDTVYYGRFIFSVSGKYSASIFRVCFILHMEPASTRLRIGLKTTYPSSWRKILLRWRQQTASPQNH
jgi:hypothetical protein